MIPLSHSNKLLQQRERNLSQALERISVFMFFFPTTHLAGPSIFVESAYQAKHFVTIIQ